MITAQEFTNSSIYRNLLNKKNDPYKDSPFYEVKILSSRSKGSIFEKITKDHLQNKFGLNISKAKSSEHDTIANDVKIEIKGSTGWVNGKGEITHFRWQQIRLAQDYDIIIFLAMYPDVIKFYYATKKDIVDNIGSKKFNQHGGNSVDSGTRSIDGFPKDFPWMKEIVDGTFITKI